MGIGLDTKLAKQSSRVLRHKATTPVREKVYSQLKSAVLSGRFDPGERLTEEHLAKKMKVSRTPVREALHKLESEGLIKPLETRGFIASRDSKEEVEELFELRSILEGYALRLVSQTVSEKALEELNSLVERAEKALEKGSIDAVFEWNTQFHDALHELVYHKHRLYRLIVDIRKYVLRYRKDTLHYPDGGKKAVEGHRKILLALRLRDPDLCERMMREHIQQAEKDALQTLFGPSGEEDGNR